MAEAEERVDLQRRMAPRPRPLGSDTNQSSKAGKTLMRGEAPLEDVKPSSLGASGTAIALSPTLNPSSQDPSSNLPTAASSDIATATMAPSKTEDGPQDSSATKVAINAAATQESLKLPRNSQDE